MSMCEFSSNLLFLNKLNSYTVLFCICLLLLVIEQLGDILVMTIFLSLSEAFTACPVLCLILFQETTCVSLNI